MPFVLILKISSSTDLSVNPAQIGVDYNGDDYDRVDNDTTFLILRMSSSIDLSINATQIAVKYDEVNGSSG